MILDNTLNTFSQIMADVWRLMGGVKVPGLGFSFATCKIKAGAYPAHLKLTLHNPNLPCKRENVKGKIKLYQTLQNYIYVDAFYPAFVSWQEGFQSLQIVAANNHAHQSR